MNHCPTQTPYSLPLRGPSVGWWGRGEVPCLPKDLAKRSQLGVGSSRAIDAERSVMNPLRSCWGRSRVLEG